MALIIIGSLNKHPTKPSTEQQAVGEVNVIYQRNIIIELFQDDAF